eukprot:TRINITY_DN4362_c0_g2_i3.p1 TRINITY_DN4362_c0_g2~~TRINITY_DN4362_c0_g2_i3.p1  ORF type:complete len:493 (+),score=104.76 TRINITY_DN4362_c0_g2_i3:122-1480(+)
MIGEIVFEPQESTSPMIRLSNGETKIVGREMLTDRRMSRNQAEISLDGGKISLRRLGKNAMCMWRKEQEVGEEIPQDITLFLNEGDRVCFLGEDFSYIVRTIMTEDKPQLPDEKFRDETTDDEGDEIPLHKKHKLNNKKADAPHAVKDSAIEPSDAPPIQEPVIVPDDVKAALAKIEEEERQRKLEQDEKDHLLAMAFQPKKCVMCLEDIDIDFFQCLSKCKHEFCRDCLQTYVNIKIDERDFPILCPSLQCKKEIDLTDLEVLLTKEKLDLYQQQQMKSVIEKNPENFICCPTPDCQYVFFWTPADSTDFKCPVCDKRYCFRCKVDWHVGVNCEAYQRWCIENGMGDDLFGDLIQNQSWKKCNRCKIFVAKNEGCDHMTCRCGYQFCYRCGNKYPCKPGQCVQNMNGGNHPAMQAVWRGGQPYRRRSDEEEDEGEDEDGFDEDEDEDGEDD